MKSFAKIMSLILAAIFMLSMMASCNPAVPGGEESPTETPAIPKDPITITTDYVIVRPELCSDEATAAVIALKNALNTATGASFSIKEDFLYGDMKPAQYEILVGQTNREESGKALASLKYEDYVVSIEGSKLVINAYNDAKLVEAVNYAIGIIEKSNGNIVFKDEDQKTFKAEYILDDVKIDDISLAGYTIILPTGAPQMVRSLVERFQMAVVEGCGIYLPTKFDNAAETDKEILIGETNREASKAVEASSLGDNGYTVKVEGTKIVVKTCDYAFSFMKTLNNMISDLDDGLVTASTGNIVVSENSMLSMFCFTDVHNNFAMLEPTNSTGDYIVRKNVDAMIDHMLKTEGAVDLVMVGGDLMSDYPHWNKCGNWPYKYFVEYRELLINTFARLSKDGKVVFCGGNHDYGQGEAATDCPHTATGNYNSSDFYFGDIGMKQIIGELPEEDMYWKIGEHTGDKYLICYYYKINGVHVLGLAPDPDIIWSKQGDGFSEESLEWMSKKLDEIDPYGTEIIFVNCHYPLDNTYEQEDGSLKISNNGYTSKKLTPVYEGHRNLFHFFGHWESWYHDYSSKAVIHYNKTNKPIAIKGTETDSTEVASASGRSFNAVNMGHFRPMYNDSPQMFELDHIKGYGGYNTYAIQHGSTRTPKCGQGMYVQVYEDRIVFTMKNIGTYEGLTTNDILESYTVWLYK